MIGLIKINELIVGYQYLILFPLVVVEGPIVTVIAGFLTSINQLSFVIAYPLIVAADLVGDSLCYLLGRWGRVAFIERWGRYIGVTHDRIEQVKHHFDRHSGKTLLLGKLLHGIGTSFLVVAGMVRMSYFRFLLFNFIATVPKSLILFLIGYYFGKGISKINSFLEMVGVIFLIIGIIAFAALYYFQKNKKI